MATRLARPYDTRVGECRTKQRLPPEWAKEAPPLLERDWRHVALVELVQLDVKMRQAMAVYLIIPLFGLAIPVSLFVLGQSYVAYRSLADRGVQAIATIQTVAETGGRHNRNAVTSTFRAADGRDYKSKAFYALDGSRHLRPGMRMGVVYQHDPAVQQRPVARLRQR